MWVYQKKLQYPIKITRPNPALAKVIISQFGGPYSNRLQKAGCHSGFLYRFRLLAAILPFLETQAKICMPFQRVELLFNKPPRLLISFHHRKLRFRNIVHKINSVFFALPCKTVRVIFLFIIRAVQLVV